jgi:ATP-dependent Clp protease ATP-binding subunit ClpC
MNGLQHHERVRKVLAMAREEAARLPTMSTLGQSISCSGLIREGEGVAATVLQNLSVELDDIQQKIEETVKKGKLVKRPARFALYLPREKSARARHERGARAQS